MTALFERAGFVDVCILHRERNARTGNEAAIVLTIEARKPRWPTHRSTLLRQMAPSGIASTEDTPAE